MNQEVFVSSLNHTSRKNQRHKINGILLLDKAVGLTSNKALQQVKFLFNAAKAGHTGSLDPLASGMLPICFGEATKFSQFLLDADKHYIVTAKLGIKTTTSDAEGEIIATRTVPDFSQQDILKALRNFYGEISQIPSMYSALKHQGQPLYKLARQGIKVDRKVRSINIYELDLLQRTSDTLTLNIHCSKGTYVRTLVEDIGETLGCGAHVIGLRRQSVTPFAGMPMVTFNFLETIASERELVQHLLGSDSALKHLPKVIITLTAAFYLKRGQPILATGAPSSGLVRLYLPSQQFLGVATVLKDGKIAPKRLIKSD